MGKYLEMRSDGNQSINRVGASGMGRAGNANAADRGNGDDRPMTSFVIQRILSRNVDESMEKQKSINKQKKRKKENGTRSFAEILSILSAENCHNSSQSTVENRIEYVVKKILGKNPVRTVGNRC